MSQLTFTNLEIPKEIYEIPRISESPLNERQFVNSTTHFTLVPYKGLLRHVEGAPYPAKGVPTPQAIFAINQVKTLVKLLVKYSPLFFFVNKNKLLNDFNIIFDKIFQPYLIKMEYLCPAAFNTSKVIATFLINLNINSEISIKVAHNLSHILEYDDAYRYRFQDIVNEADIYQLMKDPRKELKRLIEIYKYRDTCHVVTDKILKLVTPFLYLLLIPRIKKAFSISIPHIQQAKPDKEDLYWMSIRNDYLFGGLPYEVRSENVPHPLTYEIKYDKA